MGIRTRFLYVANDGDSTVEIYNISIPSSPVRLGQFGGVGELNNPLGLAITGTTLYVTNFGDSTVEIYDITTPATPVRVTQFNNGNLINPAGMVIFI